MVTKKNQCRSYLNHLVYLLIKYTKGVLWRVVKRLSYIQDARCLKVKRKEKLIPLTRARSEENVNMDAIQTTEYSNEQW